MLLRIIWAVRCGGAVAPLEIGVEPILEFRDIWVVILLCARMLMEFPWLNAIRNGVEVCV
jgi:hypothetical protein